MSEMIERVAKAMRRADLGDGTWALMSQAERDGWEVSWDAWKTSDPWIVEKWMKHARAAIEAMREPTQAMVDAGYDRDRSTAREHWSVMIDAALK